MSNWVERGKRIIEEQLAENEERVRKEAQEEAARIFKTNQEESRKMQKEKEARLEIASALGIREALADIYRKHWLIGNLNVSEDAITFCLNLEFDAAVCAVDSNELQPGVKSTSLGVHIILPRAREEYGYIIYNWLGQAQKDNGGLTVFNLVEGLPSLISPPRNSSRIHNEFWHVSFTKHGPQNSSEEVRDKLALACYRRTECDTWPTSLIKQGQEDLIGLQRA